MFERLVEQTDANEMIVYRPGVLIASALLAALLLLYFVRLKPARSAEEALEEAIDRADRLRGRDDDKPFDEAPNTNGADQNRQQATTTV
jgi:hypothetical protein